MKYIRYECRYCDSSIAIRNRIGTYEWWDESKQLWIFENDKQDENSIECSNCGSDQMYKLER